MMGTPVLLSSTKESISSVDEKPKARCQGPLLPPSPLTFPSYPFSPKFHLLALGKVCVRRSLPYCPPQRELSGAWAVPFLASYVVSSREWKPRYAPSAGAHPRGERGHGCMMSTLFLPLTTALTSRHHSAEAPVPACPILLLRVTT